MSKGSLVNPGSKLPFRSLIAWLAIIAAGSTILLWFMFGPGRPSAAPAGNVSNLSLDQRMIRIADQLQCPICEGQSVAFSGSQLAAEMRRTIEEKLAAGENEEQIIAYFVDRYGVKILREPPRQGLLTWLWVTPIVGFTLALLGLVWKLRQMSSSRRESRVAATVHNNVSSEEEDPVLDPALQDLITQYDRDFLA